VLWPRRPHVTCALSSRCSSLRSSHDSPLSLTPAHSCRGCCALLCRATTLQHRPLPRQLPPVGLCQGDLLEHRPILGHLPELSAAARSRPQVTPHRRFFRPEHLSMDRLIRSSSDPTHTTTSSFESHEPSVHFNVDLDSFSGLPPPTLLCPCAAAVESHSW
jgi:hypothetical protein